MDRTRLTPTGPCVSALSLGSWHTYERMRFDDAVHMLRRAFDAGVTYLDVSRYDPDPESPLPQGSPHTESILSRILEATGAPRHVYGLGVKIWYDHPEQSLAEHLAESMQRLGTEYVDVVSTAYPEKHGLSVEQFVDEIGEIVLSGRARTWGAGNWSAERLREIAAVADDRGMPGPTFIQQKYNVGRRAVVEDAAWVEACRELGVYVHAADVLEGGVLLGKGNRKLARDPGGARSTIAGYADEFARTAERLTATPAQLGLAFAMANPLVASTLVGCSSIEQLDDNLGAAALLDRLGAAAVRDACAPFGVDAHVLDPY